MPLNASSRCDHCFTLYYSFVPFKLEESQLNRTRLFIFTFPLFVPLVSSFFISLNHLLTFPLFATSTRHGEPTSFFVMPTRTITSAASKKHFSYAIRSHQRQTWIHWIFFVRHYNGCEVTRGLCGAYGRRPPKHGRRIWRSSCAGSHMPLKIMIGSRHRRSVKPRLMEIGRYRVPFLTILCAGCHEPPKQLSQIKTLPFLGYFSHLPRCHRQVELRC